MDFKSGLHNAYEDWTNRSGVSGSCNSNNRRNTAARGKDLQELIAD
jgi:hypothetical protein